MSASYSDLKRAQHKSSAVIEANATSEDTYTAQRAMLAADGRSAGVKAYFSTLEGNATAETIKAARAAWDASLAESEAYHAAQAELAADDQDGDDQDDDDQDGLLDADYSASHVS